jgi:hypothetical protein
METTIYHQLAKLKVEDLLREAERVRRARRVPRTRRAERGGEQGA